MIKFIRATIAILLAFACQSETQAAVAVGGAVAFSAASITTGAYLCRACVPFPATGGKAGTGGARATGGSEGTGGSKATGGKAATGGSSYSPGNLANCIAALSKDAAIKNVAAQQGVTVKSLATAECADPNILSRYP